MFRRLVFLVPLAAFAVLVAFVLPAVPFVPRAALDGFPAPEAALFFGARLEAAAFGAFAARAFFPADPAARFLAACSAGVTSDLWIMVKRIWSPNE